jgi:hypothetical protein
VGGKQTWSASRVRQHYGREKLIGKDVFRKTKQVTDRQTGKKKVIHLPTSEWIWRDVSHLRILSDELAEAVKRKLGLGAESFGRKAKDRRKRAHRVELYPKPDDSRAIRRQGPELLLLQREQRDSWLHEPGLQVGSNHRRGRAPDRHGDALHR